MRRVTLEEYEEELRLEGSGGPASSKRQKKAKAKAAKTSVYQNVGLPESVGPAEQEREEEDPFSTTTTTRTRTRLENTLYEAGLPADVGVPVVDSPAPSSIDFDYHAGAGHRSRSAGGTASTSAAHRARLLESEHKRCSVLVREGETRKKLFLLKLKHEAKAEDLEEMRRERRLQRRAVEAAVADRRAARAEKERAERQVVELRESCERERQQKEGLIDALRGREAVKRRGGRERAKAAAAKASPSPSPSPSPLPEADPSPQKQQQQEPQQPKHHRSRLRAAVVPSTKAEVETKAPKPKVDLSVPYQPPSSSSAGQRRAKRPSVPQPKLSDLGAKLGECERKDAKMMAGVAKKAGVAVVAKPTDALASIKRKIQAQPVKGNGWSGTTCLSALPTNLLFGENFRVPKLLKKK